MASNSGIRARLLYNSLLSRRRPRPSKSTSSRRASRTFPCQTNNFSSCSSRNNNFDTAAATVTSASHSTFPDLSTRPYWSASDFASEAADDDDGPVASPSSALPLSPLTPSNVSATSSLLSPSTLKSLQSLPECQSVLDLLNRSDRRRRSGEDGRGGDGGIAEPTAARAKEAYSDLRRARDILRSMPELHAATYLLEVDLSHLCGNFDSALEGLARYEHHLSTKKSEGDERTQLQFMKAKVLVHSGQFTHALSEYEDLLECMEREAERQVQRRQDKKGGEDDVPLPVIHGAAALTGIGVTKLLAHLRGDGVDADGDESDIIESMETSVDVLLESRKDASSNPLYAEMAIDLGIAACISLTNLGVAHCLLDEDGASRSIDYWKRGLETLDVVLHDSTHSVTIIPKHKFQCMESIKARLHCNISWALLGFKSPDYSSGSGASLDNITEETLKDASDSAKKALDIYDELMNGPKLLRDETCKEGADGGPTEEDATATQEWEQVLREKATELRGQSDPTKMPKDLPLSHLWMAYHRSESARALGLVAQCYASAGAAVTAEGLFQSALDASSSYPFGQSLNFREENVDGAVALRGVASSSPNLGLIARDVRLWYAMLCNNWEKRNGDADRLRSDALKIEDMGVLYGFLRDDNGTKQPVSGLEASLWLFNPLDFKR